MLASRVASFSRRTAAQALSASVAGLPSWAPAAASFGLEQPRRFMGIMDRLKGMAENRQKESLDKKKREWQSFSRPQDVVPARTPANRTAIVLTFVHLQPPARVLHPVLCRGGI